MDHKRQLRQILKLRAKGLFIQNIGPCILVVIIANVAVFLSSLGAGYLLPPYSELVLAVESGGDLSVYWLPFLKAYGFIGITTLVVTPLTMGMYAWLSDVSMLRKPKVRIVFNWLGDLRLAGRAFAAIFSFIGKALFWLVAYLLIPIAIVYFVTAYTTAIPANGALFIALVLFLLVAAGAVLALARVYAYLPVFYLLAAHPEMKVREAYQECAQFMSGRQWEFFLLVLSFFGWFFLEAVSYNLISLYVKPYFHLTVLGFTQQARGRWIVNNNIITAHNAWVPKKTGDEEG